MTKIKTQESLRGRGRKQGRSKMSVGHLMPESKEVLKKYKQVTRTKKPACKGYE